MEDLKKYMIITETNHKELERLVNTYIKIGYIPVGGVTTFLTDPQNKYKNEVKFCQAIYKPTMN